MKVMSVNLGLVLFVIVSVRNVNTFTDGSKICLDGDCEHNSISLKDIDVLGGYCADICYGKVKDIYDVVCQCENIVTTLPPPCTTTYLQDALCHWSSKTCNESAHCEWRKDMSLRILKSENITASCHCPLKENELKGPCDWTEDDVDLCSILKVNKMIFQNFECLCDPNPPTPPPGDTNVCRYTESRPAQIAPRRRKRVFNGNDAFPCNYPGVVGLFIHGDSSNNATCTATLLDEDTILFDHQCRMTLIDPVYALVDSYDVRMVNEDGPTVRMDTIIPLDSSSAGNTLFKAKLNKMVPLNAKCVQPACLPNVRIPAHHIDLDDCRVLGYGDISDTFIFGPKARRLQEIIVKVDPTSLSSDLLTVTRVDGFNNTACMSEFSAPLVCSHKYTQEWVTVGVHQYVGVFCSGEILPHMFQIANLLSEAMGNSYFDCLSQYQPKETSLPLIH